MNFIKPLRCALLATSLLTIACSSPKKGPERKDISSFDVATAGLVNGTTTEAEVISKFGPPKSTKGGGNDERESTWEFRDGRLFIANFTSGGVLIQSSYGIMQGKTFMNLGRVKPAVRPAG